MRLDAMFVEKSPYITHGSSMHFIFFVYGYRLIDLKCTGKNRSSSASCSMPSKLSSSGVQVRVFSF